MTERDIDLVWWDAELLHNSPKLTDSHAYRLCRSVADKVVAECLERKSEHPDMGLASLRTRAAEDCILRLQRLQPQTWVLSKPLQQKKGAGCPPTPVRK